MLTEKGNIIFLVHIENAKFQCTFLGGSSSILRLERRTIFSGKRKPIFTDDTENTIFQSNIFGKAISHEHFGKKNLVFGEVLSSGNEGSMIIVQ